MCALWPCWPTSFTRGSHSASLRKRSGTSSRLFGKLAFVFHALKRKVQHLYFQRTGNKEFLKIDVKRKERSPLRPSTAYIAKENPLKEKPLKEKPLKEKPLKEHKTACNMLILKPTIESFNKQCNSRFSNVCGFIASGFSLVLNNNFNQRKNQNARECQI